ncbi:MAG: hypothetical protein Tsb0014_10670 [Pleurocapsa sp.]
MSRVNQPNSKLNRQIKRLYQLTVYARWLFILISWLTIGAYAIYSLREEIARLFNYFTWSAVYYSLHFNFVPTICLAFCIGLTTSVLVWQSRNILWGLPTKEKQKLEQQVKKIMASGNKHPLWKWINS